MEDEDFGFAKRTDNVLKKVLTISNDTVHNVEQLICFPLKIDFYSRTIGNIFVAYIPLRAVIMYDLKLRKRKI